MTRESFAQEKNQSNKEKTPHTLLQTIIFHRSNIDRDQDRKKTHIYSTHQYSFKLIQAKQNE